MQGKERKVSRQLTFHIGAAENFLQVQNLSARHDKVTDSTSFTPRPLNSEAESPSKNSRTLSFPLQISLSHTLAISSSSENKKRKKLQISETNLSFTGERGTVPADAAEGGEAVGGTSPRLRGCHQAGHRGRGGEGGKGGDVEGGRGEDEGTGANES